jgi:hypothetical protein
MQRTAAKWGFWSALLIGIFTLIFLISLFFVPHFPYDRLGIYLARFRPAKVFPALPSLLIALCHLPLFVAFKYFAEDRKKIWASAGNLFGTAYVVCVSIVYFTQITHVVQSIRAGRTQHIEPFLLDNPLSFLLMQDILGYLFLMIALVFWSRLFMEGLLDRWIRTMFWVTAILGIVGVLGTVLQAPVPGLGILLSAAAYAVLTVLLILRFARSMRE